MISPVLRLLVVGVVLVGAPAGSALAGRPAVAQPSPPLTPTVPPATPSSTACHRTSFSNNRPFPETGYAVSGDFANYWDRNGGLSQQGYPISPVIEEISDLDGKPYTVQYFERAVFECHPENLGSEFAVLLAQLGTFQYRQKYPQGAPGQRPNGERPLFFAATGHTLGGEFRTYWEAHGGISQQGLPLSDEFSEVSPLDGKRYTVQYFERAVFEYHPENAPPYRVLLSQLGTLRYRAKYPTPPPPIPLPTPDPTGPLFLGYLPTNFSCDDPTASPLAAGGASLFWLDANSPFGAAILGYDVNLGRQLSAALPRDVRRGLVSDGRTLVWQEERVDPPSGTYTYDFHGYNPRTGGELPPLRSTVKIRGWAVGDDTLYYLSGNPTGGFATELYTHNWTTGQTTRIATAPTGAGFFELAAGAGYVAWSEVNSNQQERLYLAPARNPTAAAVISTDVLRYRQVSLLVAGDHLIWNQVVRQADGSYDFNDVEVRMYTISTETTQVLVRGAGAYLSASENRVAWVDSGSADHFVPTRAVVLDLGTGQTHIQELLPPVDSSCVTLVGSALAYIRVSGSPHELYLQPLP